jgi:hypothetical protein
MTRSVFLINGEQVGVPAQGPAGQVVGTDSGGSLQVLTLGGHSYVLPDDAVPYLGHGLDPSLFEVSALARAESGGRLPVRVSYTGQTPDLPGVTITSSGSGPATGHHTATGYLTAAGAAKLGAALARQYTADRTRASYGQDGLFAHGASLALASAPTTGSAAKTTTTKTTEYTLTVDGTNRSGQPDNGDYVVVSNVDNSRLFSNPKDVIGVFHNGVAKFTVPAGNYWAVGEFNPGFFTVSRVVVLPQFGVTTNTTVHVDEAAATSQFQFTTARPSYLRDIGFQLNRTPASGPTVGILWNNSLGETDPAPPMWVNPTQASPTIGALTSQTEGWLFPPKGTPHPSYEYDLAFQAHGTIPAQRYVINQASLATEHARFYEDASSRGLEGRTPVFPVENRTENLQTGGVTSITPFDVVKMPTARTVYVSTGAGLSWAEGMYPSVWWAGYGGQQASAQVYAPGQRVTTHWGAFPLHPMPDVYLTRYKDGLLPLTVSANRSGDNLTMYLTAFSDSVAGHLGGPVIFKPFTATASYVLDQNGKQIGSGSLPRFHGDFGVKATLSPKPSTISLELDTAVDSSLQPLSTASQTVWTWRSAHESGSTVPVGWSCNWPLYPRSRDCSAQPIMTLRYGVVGEALDGSVAAGQQVIKVAAGHLQLASQPEVTGLTMQVSFDGGKTWHNAGVTGTNGSYAAVFSAPAGAKVTLRTSATDAAGGSIAETIDNAYQIAS